MIWIILGIIVVLVLIVVGVYNGLVKSRMQTREAWSQIDVQLKRRNDLIPNLIETVKGYAKYEGDTLAKVTQLRQQVAQASSPAEAMAASDALSRQVAGIFAVAENYPDLKANTNFMQLQEELTNTENKISYARQLYNSVTSNYNVKLETFPTNVIAGMFGFKQAEFLQVPEEEKAVPKVDFSGYLWLGSSLGGVILALIIGGIYAFSMIFQSTEVVMRMNGAREVTEEQAPQLYHIVQDMAMVAQIPMPRVYIVDDPSMNAFATGSNPQNAAVAATTGLLAVMNREELEGVIGHEVSHIRNYDIRISTIAVALASAITMLSSIGGRMMWWGGGRSRDDDREGSGGLEIVMLILSLLAIVLAPLAATLVQLAISRQREFLADASSVELTRNPQGMINALLKLDNSEPMQRHVDDASSALFINDPKKESGLQKLFYTHPPIAERVARLRKM